MDEDERLEGLHFIAEDGLNTKTGPDGLRGAIVHV